MEHLFNFLFDHWLLLLSLIMILGAIIWLEKKGAAGGVKALSSQEIVQLINREQAMVLDVRGPSDFSAGHIANAQNMPRDNVEHRMQKLEKRKEHPIIMVCKNGMQSQGIAAKWLKQGFTTLYCLKGGMQAWQADNLPTVKNK